ncbi:DUF4192 domain-containing protein [Streptomyces sp. Isolate_219]|uniref:DUF4192 domain-containing protein n=1 Tax=Streptomyces sp. Isolate_219 TaxID=2950110 RepID=UPI0021C75801|nr:DUF4192 domain-containing protein [Streptomyces sp. Isolate_219]MCR8573049.1 DUF4192 domain-containing protein [Streptomyces sp. Isolate_219]
MNTSKIHLRGPGQLAEFLPFLVHHRPEDSIVVHHSTGAEFIEGATMTVPLPEDPATWTVVADTFAQHVIDILSKRGHALNTITVYLCRDTRPGQTADHIADLLRPAADRIASILKNHGAKIQETIGLVNDRWWAYECLQPNCCAGERLPALDDPNSLTTELLRRGLTPGRRTSEIASEFRPTATNATRYRQALDAVAADLQEQTLTRLGKTLTRNGTAKILAGALKDFRNGNTQLPDEIAARLILGLQDNKARDQALAYSEDDDLPHARQLWAHLARRCVPPHTDKAPPLLTLLGWIAWRQGDTITARIAFKDALTTDVDYRMADILHHTINCGTDPEQLLDLFRTVGCEQPVED